MDELDLACTPAEEACEQLGPNYDPAKARRECRAYVHQLKRQFGDPPVGTRFRIKSNPHDFGSYLDVVVVFDADSAESVDYAFRCEAEAPARWDAEARAELAVPSEPVR